LFYFFHFQLLCFCLGNVDVAVDVKRILFASLHFRNQGSGSKSAIHGSRKNMGRWDTRRRRENGRDWRDAKRNKEAEKGRWWREREEEDEEDCDCHSPPPSSSLLSLALSDPPAFHPNDPPSQLPPLSIFLLQNDPLIVLSKKMEKKRIREETTSRLRHLHEPSIGVNPASPSNNRFIRLLYYLSLPSLWLLVPCSFPWNQYWNPLDFDHSISPSPSPSPSLVFISDFSWNRI